MYSLQFSYLSRFRIFPKLLKLLRKSFFTFSSTMKRSNWLTMVRDYIISKTSFYHTSQFTKHHLLQLGTICTFSIISFRFASTLSLVLIQWNPRFISTLNFHRSFEYTHTLAHSHIYIIQIFTKSSSVYPRS